MNKEKERAARIAKVEEIVKRMKNADEDLTLCLCIIDGQDAESLIIPGNHHPLLMLGAIDLMKAGFHKMLSK